MLIEIAWTSCIVLHGFGAHALGAFQGRNSPDIWIRDWLPNDFPKLDILTYGYGTQFSDPSSTGDIYEWAEAFRSDLRAYRSRTKVRYCLSIFVSPKYLGGISCALRLFFALPFATANKCDGRRETRALSPFSSSSTA